MTDIVIGAGSGMGVAVAEMLAPRGKLLIADVKSDTVEALARRLGGEVEAIGCDITDQAQIDALMARVDHLDAFIVTAGIGPSMGGGRQIFEINLRGVQRAMDAALPRARAGSVAVCFSSSGVYGLVADEELFRVLDDPLATDFYTRFEAMGMNVDDPHFGYPMSKLGIRRMMARLAPAWGAKGARTMCVSPGINDTPMNRLDEQQHPVLMAEAIKKSPLGRRGTPQEIANVVEFLISEKAAFMTGSDVVVDGGMMPFLPPRAPYR
jgi:NAD(P)-dependent dehydrogenase (short-subunit alcohol dehydrogenase family)